MYNLCTFALLMGDSPRLKSNSSYLLVLLLVQHCSEFIHLCSYIYHYLRMKVSYALLGGLWHWLQVITTTYVLHAILRWFTWAEVSNENGSKVLEMQFVDTQ